MRYVKSISDQEIMADGDYIYSPEMVVRAWPTGKICVQVGYVKQHPERNRIVLSKTWIGPNRKPQSEKYNIRDANDWHAIRRAVEKLWPELGTEPTQRDIDAAIRMVTSEVQLLELVAQYPEVLSQLPADIDILRLPRNQKQALRNFLTAGGQIAQTVIERLSVEPVEDLEGFVAILTELRLSTVNALINHVRSRLAFIGLFEKAIHDDSAYERRGRGSIHNLLKANIWILDRNYAILHDDETLKNIILTRWDKTVQGQAELQRRPDFLCMVNRKRSDDAPKEVVLIEIKRPSVTLSFTHVEQLMEYREILERYSGTPITAFRAFLVGREINRALRGNDLSKSGFVCKTYTDFIAEARSFYEEYMRIIEEEDLAV